MTALEAVGIGFHYGARQALKDVSFSLQPGRFTALLGPNGAGKSTLIALLTRLYDLQQGELHVYGHSLQRQPREALRQLGVVFQQSTLDLDLSVEQNLRYHAALHGMPGKLASARIDAELSRQQLQERRRDKVRDLNGGHRRRVEIARALLLDEASVGLDPAARQGLLGHVRQLCRDEDLSVLWTTHLLDEVQGDDELLVLYQGQLVANGSAREIAGEQGLATAFQALTVGCAVRTTAPTIPTAGAPSTPYKSTVERP